MNRVIKFRALAVVNDKQNNIKVGDFVYGSYIESNVDAPCIIWGDGEQIEINKKTLGQLTGVKDMFGDDIFEGDIVESDYYLPEMKSISFIEFKVDENTGHFGFNGGEQDAFRYGSLRVFGDIHTTPELLEVN